MTGFITPLLTFAGYRASKRFGRGCKPRPALAFKRFSRGCKPRPALVGSRKSQITLENWRNGVYNPVTHLCRLSSIQTFRSGLQTPTGIGIQRFQSGLQTPTGIVGSLKSQITLENWRDGVYNPVTHVCRLSSIQTFRSGLQTPTGIANNFRELA